MKNTKQPIQKNVVTIPQKEYVRLAREARAYREMTAKVFDLPLRDPVDDVVNDFRATDLYSDKFLADLEKNLHKSSYTK